jgi:hypothetical protein
MPCKEAYVGGTINLAQYLSKWVRDTLIRTVNDPD